MVGEFEVVWSPQAELDLQGILLLWLENNKSSVYSEKLYSEILATTNKLTANPYLGTAISIEDYRRVLVRYYLIIYRVEKQQVRILRIWDGRQKEVNV